MQSDDEIIAVVQAHKEGKKIQHRIKGNDIYEQGEWSAPSSGMPMAWNFSKYDYRVAPEPPKPREFWLLDSDGFVIGCRSPQETQSRYLVNDLVKLIHVREVIGASSGNPAVALDAEALGTISGHRAVASDTASYNPK